MDYEILNALRSREAYDRFSRFVKPSTLNEEAYNLFAGMGEWLGYTPTATEVDWPHFGAWWCMVRHAKMAADKLNLYRELIEALGAMDPADPDRVKPLLEGLVTRDYASKIAEQSLRIADGDFTISMNNIVDLVEARNNDIGKINDADASMLTPTVDSIASVSAAGLRWRMNCLNESLGDFRKGDFIVLGKRPDSGGTTFLASEATWMAEQLATHENGHVLWVNNEESGNKVFRRILQSALGCTVDKIDGNIEDALEQYGLMMGGTDRILMLNKANVHVRDVERMLKKYEVGLIIFDQLWKVHGFDKEAGHEVTRQTMLFNWAREIAKTYGPVLTVHQADGMAEGMKWIDMSRLYGSKTGIQGEADAIITIGRVPDEGNRRYIYVPKNKMAGKNPTLRNGKFEVDILPETARWKEWT